MANKDLNSSIDFWEVTKITDDAAEVLSKGQGKLWLGGLTELSDAAAESLSKHEGELHLNSLTQLSDAAAELLSKSQGPFGPASWASLVSLSTWRPELNLSGLTELSDAAAESLSKYEGFLSLDGLTELSDAAAESLSKHHGSETFLTEAPLNCSLAQFVKDGKPIFLGKLSLNGLTELTDAAAESLSKQKGGLNLNGLTELSDAAAESLSKYQWNLSLGGLTKLSDAAAESLSKYQEMTSLSDGLIENSNRHCGIFEGLTELSDAAAESLSKHESETISLNGLIKLSDAAAESLSKYKGKTIGLNGLKELSDAAAESIGKYKGSLLLRGLKKLTPTAATKLCGVDFLELTISKKNMTGALTRALAGFRGSWLGLSGFSSLSDECAHELSKFRGKKLSFNLSEHKIVRKLSREGARSLGEILNLLSSKCSIDYDLAKKAEIDLDSEQDRSPDYVDEDFAQKWIRGSSWMYSLEKAKKISNEAAVRLGQHEDEYAEFQLCNLNELSETAAVALAKCRGKLWLDGLTEVSDAVVEALAKHEGPLSLNGVTELSDAAAQSLSKHRGELSLWSVGKISEQAATAMLQKPAGTINGMIPAEWVANLSQ